MNRRTMKLASLAGLAALTTLAGADAATSSRRLGNAACDSPPIMRCPDMAACGALVTEQGPVLEPKTGRRYFLDYPCDLKPKEKVTVVLNLHGGGSYGNWQRHYFPIADYAKKYRMVIATPNSPTRVWGAVDDAYLQNITQHLIDEIGAKNIKAFWLAGHSQGELTSRRIVCSDFFKDKVDGWISLSGSRLGEQPAGGPGGINEPTLAAAKARAANPNPAPQPSALPGGARPAGGGPGRAAFGVDMNALPSCDFSFIYENGEYEMGLKPLPSASPWAERYGCKTRVRRRDVVDVKAGQVYDSSQQNPPRLSWGLPAGPGTTEIYEFPRCKDGRVVADVVRLNKGHTEGLEPKITEKLVQMMLSAKGGKIARG